jgi:hypothetical protein
MADRMPETPPPPTKVEKTKDKPLRMCKHADKIGVDAEYLKKCKNATCVCTRCGRTALDPALVCKPQLF